MPPKYSVQNKQHKLVFALFVISWKQRGDTQQFGLLVNVPIRILLSFRQSNKIYKKFHFKSVYYAYNSYIDTLVQ